MTLNPTTDERLARLKAYPQFREAKLPSWNGRIAHSMAQKPQATDAAPHGDGDEPQ